MYMCSAVLSISQLYTGLPNDILPSLDTADLPEKDGQVQEKKKYNIQLSLQYKEYTQYFSFSKKLLIFLKLNTISI